MLSDVLVFWKSASSASTNRLADSPANKRKSKMHPLNRAKAFIKYSPSSQEIISPETNVQADGRRHKRDINTFRRFFKIRGVSKIDLTDSDEQKTSQEAHEQQLDQDEEDEDQYSDDGEPNDEDEDDRRDFKAIRAITRKEVKEFVLETLHADSEQDSRTCHVTKRKEGSFHHVVFVHTKIGDQLEQQYVLKIPAHGTIEHWEEGDGFMLRNEAVLMQHIRHHTHCPVPEVVAFDDDTHNALGVPFILMKEMPGKLALDLWAGKPFRDVQSNERYDLANDSSPELEQKRFHFLASLAQAMGHLQTLKFKKIGMHIFDKPEDEVPKKFGPVWRWHTTSCMQQLHPVGPFSSEGFYFHYGTHQAWHPSMIEDLEPDSYGALVYKGVQAILSQILYSTPFATPAPPPATVDDEGQPMVHKNFVLRHDDLNLQNIRVDDEGNVTGIIDWGGCHAVPRCVGFASLPLFLRGDWLDDQTQCAMMWSLNRYRSIFADAMKEACQTDDGSLSDAQYTNKSAMYQALLAVFFDGETCLQFVAKVLNEIVDFRRVNAEQLCAQLGKGWPAAEKVLAEKIAELMAPEVQEWRSFHKQY
ncbi:hypothetical protein CC86DRAFT_398063 [Ophiobolus disseminans]|uniref:Aminoglycoside phosphotransferase domain-containing protein n=1 Tax=Ophiobolus disseminans TaxID=1469910 RepID=A0A6A6ZHJ8_9PLEO|nr:hypothetical protein CC86DRAFT_398063 [Ophiobolus disseminans]